MVKHHLPVPDDRVTAETIRGLLAHLLAGAAGGSEMGWRKLITIETLPISLFPRSNWKVEATGTTRERAAIANAVRIVRGEYPYVSS